MGPRSGSREELDPDAGLAQVIDAEGVGLVFDADAHPDIGRSVHARVEFQQASRAFGQHLERVPVRAVPLFNW